MMWEVATTVTIISKITAAPTITTVFANLFWSRLSSLFCCGVLNFCAASPVRGFMQYRQNAIFSGKVSPQYGHFFVASSLGAPFSGV